MFTRLRPDQYPSVRPLFDALAFNIEVLSILDSNTRGQVFVDDPVRPHYALVWDELATLFVAGPPEEVPGLAAGPFGSAAQLWITETAIPQAQSWGIPDLTLFYDPPAWQAQLTTLFANHRLTPGLRHHYTHTGASQPEIRLPEGYSLQPIDAALLERNDLASLDWLGGWILSFWPSPGDFVDRGLGYVVLGPLAAGDGEEPATDLVSLCISVFVSGTAYEFGTATQERHRNLGLSTAATRACIQACLARNLHPVWHCWADNAPSVAVAHKTGFTRQREYEVLRLWILEPKKA